MYQQRSEENYALGDGFCASYHRGVELIGRRWNGVILREMLLGATRFSQIRQGIPALSDKMLTSRLRELEAAGVITRQTIGDKPAAVEYQLTPMGRDLEIAVAALNRWASRWLPDEAQQPEVRPARSR